MLRLDHEPRTVESWREHDRRSLALMRLTVAKIDADPTLLQIGVENMERWRKQRGYQPKCLDQWEEWFAGGEPWERIRARLLEESDEGQRLRTSHPLTGLLTDEERESVFDFDADQVRRDHEARTGRAWPESFRALDAGVVGRGDPEGDARSLAYAKAIVAKIDANPSLGDIAHENLARWRAHRGRRLSRASAEWEGLLERLDWAGVPAILLDPSDEGQRLRSSHPFVGVLSETQRRAILDGLRGQHKP